MDSQQQQTTYKLRQSTASRTTSSTSIIMRSAPQPQQQTPIAALSDRMESIAEDQPVLLMAPAEPLDINRSRGVKQRASSRAVSHAFEGLRSQSGSFVDYVKNRISSVSSSSGTHASSKNRTSSTSSSNFAIAAGRSNYPAAAPVVAAAAAKRERHSSLAATTSQAQRVGGYAPPAYHAHIPSRHQSLAAASNFGASVLPGAAPGTTTEHIVRSRTTSIAIGAAPSRSVMPGATSPSRSVMQQSSFGAASSITAAIPENAPIDTYVKQQPGVQQAAIQQLVYTTAPHSSTIDETTERYEKRRSDAQPTLRNKSSFLNVSSALTSSRVTPKTSRQGDLRSPSGRPSPSSQKNMQPLIIEPSSTTGSGGGGAAGGVAGMGGLFDSGYDSDESNDGVPFLIRLLRRRDSLLGNDVQQNLRHSNRTTASRTFVRKASDQLSRVQLSSAGGRLGIFGSNVQTSGAGDGALPDKRRSADGVSTQYGYFVPKSLRLLAAVYTGLRTSGERRRSKAKDRKDSAQQHANKLAADDPKNAALVKTLFANVIDPTSVFERRLTHQLWCLTLFILAIFIVINIAGLILVANKLQLSMSIQARQPLARKMFWRAGQLAYAAWSFTLWTDQLFTCIFVSLKQQPQTLPSHVMAQCAANIPSLSKLKATMDSFDAGKLIYADNYQQPVADDTIFGGVIVCTFNDSIASTDSTSQIADDAAGHSFCCGESSNFATTAQLQWTTSGPYVFDQFRGDTQTFKHMTDAVRGTLLADGSVTISTTTPPPKAIVTPPSPEALIISRAQYDQVEKVMLSFADRLLHQMQMWYVQLTQQSNFITTFGEGTVFNSNDELSPVYMGQLMGPALWGVRATLFRMFTTAGGYNDPLHALLLQAGAKEAASELHPYFVPAVSAGFGNVVVTDTSVPTDATPLEQSLAQLDVKLLEDPRPTMWSPSTTPKGFVLHRTVDDAVHNTLTASAARHVQVRVNRDYVIIVCSWIQLAAFFMFNIFTIGIGLLAVVSVFNVVTAFHQFRWRLARRSEKLRSEAKGAGRMVNEMFRNLHIEALLIGELPEPNVHAQATVAFIELCHVSQMVNWSLYKPQEIIELLEWFYSIVQEITLSYSTFIVATTGPILFLTSFDKDKHCGDVCFAALNIICNFSAMSLPPPLSGFIPLIKVGIATGPVAGAIVSLKFPLYTLIGDTVNTASRMNSASKPYRILTSKQVYINECNEGYRFVFNDMVFLKGKGVCETYWLTEHEFFPYKVDLEEADYLASNNNIEINAKECAEAVRHWRQEQKRKKQPEQQESQKTTDAEQQSLEQTSSLPTGGGAKPSSVRSTASNSAQKTGKKQDDSRVSNTAAFPLPAFSRTSVSASKTTDFNQPQTYKDVLRRSVRQQHKQIKHVTTSRTSISSRTSHLLLAPRFPQSQPDLLLLPSPGGGSSMRIGSAIATAGPSVARQPQFAEEDEYENESNQSSSSSGEAEHGSPESSTLKISTTRVVTTRRDDERQRKSSREKHQTRASAAAESQQQRTSAGVVAGRLTLPAESAATADTTASGRKSLSLPPPLERKSFAGGQLPTTTTTTVKPFVTAANEIGSTSAAPQPGQRPSNAMQSTGDTAAPRQRTSMRPTAVSPVPAADIVTVGVPVAVAAAARARRRSIGLKPQTPTAAAVVTGGSGDPAGRQGSIDPNDDVNNLLNQQQVRRLSLAMKRPPPPTLVSIQVSAASEQSVARPPSDHKDPKSNKKQKTRRSTSINAGGPDVRRNTAALADGVKPSSSPQYGSPRASSPTPSGGGGFLQTRPRKVSSPFSRRSLVVDNDAVNIVTTDSQHKIIVNRRSSEQPAQDLQQKLAQYDDDNTHKSRRSSGGHRLSSIINDSIIGRAVRHLSATLAPPNDQRRPSSDTSPRKTLEIDKDDLDGKMRRRNPFGSAREPYQTQHRTGRLSGGVPYKQQLQRKSGSIMMSDSIPGLIGGDSSAQRRRSSRDSNRGGGLMATASSFSITAAALSPSASTAEPPNLFKQQQQPLTSQDPDIFYAGNNVVYRRITYAHDRSSDDR